MERVIGSCAVCHRDVTESMDRKIDEDNGLMHGWCKPIVELHPKLAAVTRRLLRLPDKPVCSQGDHR